MQTTVTPGAHTPGSGAVILAPDFETLAGELQASDIYVGLQTAVYGTMVWVTDRNAWRRQDLLIEFDRETSHVRSGRDGQRMGPCDGVGTLSRQPLCPTSR